MSNEIWLFHSLLADASSCAPLAAALEHDRADRHRSARESCSPTPAVTIPDLLATAPAPGLEPVADALAATLPGPVTLFGNGYGSFVALTLALRHPAKVTRLVLAGAGAAFPEPGRAAFRAMAAAPSLDAIADTAMRRLFPPEFQDAHPDLLAERRARFLATDPATFRAACHALAALDLRDAVRTLATPTLVMAGDQDEATPPAMAEELATLLPHATFRLLPGLAHLPQLQDPALIAAAIREA